MDGQNEQKLGWTSTEGGNAGLTIWWWEPVLFFVVA